MKTAIDFIAYVFVRVLVAVIQTLPTDMGDSLCRFAAWLASGPLRIRRSATEHNLKLIFPDATDRQRRNLEFAMWRSLLLMVCEIAWVRRRVHRTNYRRYIKFEDNQTMLRLMLSDRPTVAVTGHFGNFEIGGYITGLMGINTLTIARKLDNRFLHAWVDRFRSATGQAMVDKEGCATDVDRHLAGGGILSLLADQHAGPKGCWVNFMGAPASCHKALALFSLASGAPMMVGSARRIDGQPLQLEIACHAVADPRIDAEICESVTSLTNWYNEQLTAVVARSLEQYWWLHRRWREPPVRIAARLAKRAA